MDWWTEYFIGPWKNCNLVVVVLRSSVLVTRLYAIEQLNHFRSIIILCCLYALLWRRSDANLSLRRESTETRNNIVEGRRSTRRWSHGRNEPRSNDERLHWLQWTSQKHRSDRHGRTSRENYEIRPLEWVYIYICYLIIICRCEISSDFFLAFAES